MTLMPRDSLFGLILAPVIWTACFVLLYAVSGVACSHGYGDTEFAGVNALRLVLLVVAGVAALLIAVAGIQGLSAEHHIGAGDQAPDPADRTRQSFLYAVALVLCGLSLVGTLWLAIAVFTTPLC